ncbi:hypothetical protein T492DRAFT_838532 [Pavlovales sp. CCMP2436]|nr:hypothetical protein T492DRAFT_838532 [Pavlovales sp. CCMP2436]
MSLVGVGVVRDSGWLRGSAGGAPNGFEDGGGWWGFAPIKNVTPSRLASHMRLRYHPAAKLIEKVRIAAGKPKSSKRAALEEEMAAGICSHEARSASGAGGPNLGLDPNGRYWMEPGVRIVKDALGRNSMSY